MHILSGSEKPYFTKVNVCHKEQFRVLRGGSYFNHAIHCRATYRNHNLPDNQHNHIGFRLVFPAHDAGVQP